MTRKHLISVCAVALMASSFSPAYAADNGPAGIDVGFLLSYEGGGGVGISTAGVPGPSNGYDGGGGVGISTAGVPGPAPAGGTTTFDGGGGSGGSI
jgi:hypothetical protein